MAAADTCGASQARTLNLSLRCSLVHWLGLPFPLHRKELPEGPPNICCATQGSVCARMLWHQQLIIEVTATCTRPEVTDRLLASKAEHNVSRDAEHIASIESLGLRVLVIGIVKPRTKTKLGRGSLGAKNFLGLWQMVKNALGIAKREPEILRPSISSQPSGKDCAVVPRELTRHHATGRQPARIQLPAPRPHRYATSGPVNPTL
jgi:G:T-mismatch repair DNA endonuclease (very short patch repair protein)